MQDAQDAMRGLDDSVRQHDADIRREFDAMRESHRTESPPDATQAAPDVVSHSDADAPGMDQADEPPRETLADARHAGDDRRLGARMRSDDDAR
jgi:hypothetical protein